MERLKKSFVKLFDKWWPLFNSSNATLVPYKGDPIVERQYQNELTSSYSKSNITVPFRKGGDGVIQNQEDVLVGVVGSAGGPAVRAQKLVIQRPSADSNWSLALVDHKIFIVCYKNHIYVSKPPHRTWNIETFRKTTSVLLRKQVHTFLLCLKRSTQGKLLDRHTVCSKILPFLEDFVELVNFGGQIELKLVRTDPYPTMRLDLVSRQQSKEEIDKDGDCDEASLLAREDSSSGQGTNNSRIRYSMMVLMSQPHAFHVTCRFTSTNSIAGDAEMTMMEEILWDK